MAGNEMERADLTANRGQNTYVSFLAGNYTRKVRCSQDVNQRMHVVGLSSAARAAGDAAADKITFSKYAVRHSIDPARSGAGPTLFGVIGKHSATLEGFVHSPRY